MIRLRTGNCVAVRLHAVRVLAHDEAVRAHVPRTARGGGAGTRRRARWRRRRPRRPPPASAPSCAAPSMPIASPLTTVTPAPPRNAPISRASASPCGVALRVPTTATRGACKRFGRVALGEQHGRPVGERLARSGSRRRRRSTRACRVAPARRADVGAASTRCAHVVASVRVGADRRRAARGVPARAATASSAAIGSPNARAAAAGAPA